MVHRAVFQFRRRLLSSHYSLVHRKLLANESFLALEDKIWIVLQRRIKLRRGGRFLQTGEDYPDDRLKI